MAHRQSTDRRRAIRGALQRLGLHLGASRVVAELAGDGVSVSEDQVEEVKIDLVKTPDQIHRRMAELHRPDLRRTIRPPGKHGHRH
jgi:hypothetical protein